MSQLPPTAPPAGALALDPGLIGYTVEGLVHGGAVDVTIHLSVPTSATGYAKYDGVLWTSMTEGTDFEIALSGLSVTLHLVDGGQWDSDGLANGTIVDPGALVEASPL